MKQVSDLGYRHLIYTDISRDGMQTGIDAAAYQRIAAVFRHGVTASGGIADMTDILALGEFADAIEGVIAGRALYEHSLDVREAVQACNELTHKALVGKIADKPCTLCEPQFPGDED